MKNKLFQSHPTTLFLLNVLQKQLGKVFRLFLTALVLQLAAISAFGQISITSGSAITQDFTSLGATAAATLPTGFKIGGSGATNYTAAGTATTAAAGTTGTGALTGSSGGALYNFANGVTASSSDRAVGWLNSGSFASPGYLYMWVQNNSGSNITAFTVAFDYEKYRAGTRAWTMTFDTGRNGTTFATMSGGTQSYGVDGANAVVNPPTTTSKSVTITLASPLPNGAGFYFRWTSTGTGGSTNGQGIGLDNISVTPTIAGCAAATPTFTASAGSTTCLNTNVTYTTQSGQTNYSWSVPGTVGTDWTLVSGSTSNTSNTVTIKWLTTGSKTVTVNYCGGTAAATNTTSVPGLTVTGAYTVIAGSTTTLTASVAGGTITGDSWTSSASTIASVDASGNVTGVSSGVAIITYAGTIGSCSVSDTQRVTVPAVTCSGTPAAGTAIAGTTLFCASGSTTITFSGSTGAGISYQWESSGDSSTWTAVSGATNATLATGTLTSTRYYHVITTCSVSGLSNTSTGARVTISPLPTIAVTPAGGAVCSGAGGLSMTASGASSYTWSPATGLSATATATTVATPTTTITYTVSGTSSVGCIGTNTVTVTYNLSPSAISLSPSAITMCPGATPQRIVVSGGSVGPTTASSGTISLSVNGGALATTTHTLTVTGIPAGASITAASVNLTASLPWQDDYVVNLVSPDGHVFNLINQKGIHSVGGGSFSNTTISSNSTNPFVGGGSTIPASTTFQADAINTVGGSPYVSNVTAWSGLTGTPNGNWTIVFYQATTFANPSGTLNNWSLTLNYNYRSVTWSPTTRLFNNAAGTVAYAGSIADTVYAGADTAASTIVYTATATNGSCAVTASDTVTVNPKPTISGTFALSPTTVCPGSSVSLTFTGSTSGSGTGTFVAYNWTGPGAYASSSVAATTSFTPTTSAMSGVYSVSATYSYPGCTSAPLASSVSLNVASPAAYSVTGGFGCASSGINIGISNSDGSVMYQLQRGGSSVGAAILGTGSAFSFGTFTTPGVYTVFADNGSCSQYMNDSAVIYDTIATYNVTGGGVASGAGCASPGLIIGLSSSQPSVSYQLYRGASPLGSPVAGTGAAITFNGGAAITTAGTYTVSATIGSCTQTMTGSSDIYSTLNSYSVTGGTGCTSPGLAIGVSATDAGARYQLYNYGLATGSPVTGSGAAISFGTISTLGSYTVQASVGGGCALNMSGSAIVYGAPSFTVTPATTAICASPGRALTVTPGTAPLTILNENFDGTISSDGWTTDYTTVAWAQTTGATYSWSSSSISSSGKFYILNDGISANTSSHIVSPSFSLVGLASASLTFNSFFDLGSSETAGVDISTNGGTTWTSVFNATNNWTSSGAYSLSAYTVSLNAYVGNSNVKMRFRYDKASAGTSYLFAVDNAKVTGTPPTSAYSWSPAAGLSIATGLTATAIPTVSTIYTVSVLGCTAGTASVTVDALPTAGTIGVSATNICLGSGATLILSETGTPTGPSGATLQSYSWSGPNSYLSTGTATTVGSRTITPTTTAESGIYSLTVTYNEPGCVSAPVTSPSVTVDYLPSIAVGANPSICLPATSVNISYSSATGSPTTYSITWDAATLAAGFSNITGASLPSVISVSLPTGATGVFHGALTVANANCTSNTYNFTITVYAHPDAAITSAPGLCSGYATNITFTGTPGAIIAYSIDGASPFNATLTGGTYTLSTGVITSSHTYRLIDAHNPVCATTIDTTITINPTPMEWVGGTAGNETNWNTAANWACGFVPGIGDNATIPAGTTYQPTLATADSATVKNLIIASGATVVVNSNATLAVKGNLINNGSVTGGGALSMSGSSAQHIQGIGSVNNFDLNNAAGSTVDAAARILIKSTLSVTTGTLNTGDSVVLNSDSASTARIAPLPASGAVISGNVKVLTYIEGGRRAYRFWSHPFSGNTGLTQVLNYIDVSGAGGPSNGFTYTASASPSAFRYNPLVGNSSLTSDPGWKPFTSAYTTADSNRIHPYQGIRLFYRGAKGEGLGYLPYVPSAVTIGQWGAVNQGTQTVTLSKGSASPYQDYNMVGNPYASPTDIGTVIHNGLAAGNVVGPAYFIWNPSLGTAGQFQAQFITTTTAVPYYLQTCNAFQIRAAYNGSTLTFNENNKGVAATANLFKAQQDFISLKIYDADYHPYDMVYLQFNDAATTANDYALDAVKPFGGAGLNFYSVSSDDQKLIIDSRPYDNEKTIALGVTTNVAQDYIIKAEIIALPTDAKLYLHDKLLQQYVLLQAGTEYRFTVSNNVATQGDGRFELAAKPANTVSSEGLKVTLSPNPATDEVVINYTQTNATGVTVSITDIAGVSIFHQDMGMQVKGSANVSLSTFAPGIYVVELTSGKEKVVQRLVKE